VIIELSKARTCKISFSSIHCPDSVLTTSYPNFAPIRGQIIKDEKKR
jgi:hypothetical protein